MRHNDLANLKVLIVDDNGHFLSILKQILHGFGIRQATGATSVLEGIERLTSSEFDFAFVDYHMPEGTGLDFIDFVRLNPDSPNPKLPVIMASAYAEKHVVLSAIRHGVNAFLVKPICAAAVYKRLVREREHPPSYIRTVDGYFGPDRRQDFEPSYTGPERRSGRLETVASSQDDVLID